MVLERDGGNRGDDERDGGEMGKRVDRSSFQMEVWGNLNRMDVDDLGGDGVGGGVLHLE